MNSITLDKEEGGKPEAVVVSEGETVQQVAQPQSGAGEEEVNLGDPLVTQHLRYDFYRTNYKLTQVVMIASLLFNALMGYGMYAVATNPPKPVYVATYGDGRVLPLQALSEPIVTDTSLLTWVKEAVADVNSYNYNTWRRDLQKSSDHFTGTGYEAFLKKFDEAGIIKMISERSIFVTSNVTGTAAITARGVINGVYHWRVEVPVDVTYTPYGGTPTVQRLIVKLVVRRMSVLENPRGIGIEVYNTAER